MPNVKATNALRKRSDAAVESFHNYYAKIWGEERWHNSLFPALSRPTRYCALVNGFNDWKDKSETLQNNGSDEIHKETCIDELASCIGWANSLKLLDVVTRSSDHPFAHPSPVVSANAEKALLSHWLMDFASVLAASLLQVQPGHKVLDLCAAPGGKSVVLSQMLFPQFYSHPAPSDEASSTCFHESTLHSNEFDRGRYKRLELNLHSYLPEQLFASHAVDVLRVDGTAKTAISDLPLGEDGYDRVLVDAPCSSERHLIHAYLAAASAGQVSEAMGNWKSSHTKTLAKTQSALLMKALKAAKIGGSVLYATCSISVEENDDVVDRVLETLKRERRRTTNCNWKIQVNNALESNVAARTILDKLTERTKHGRIALPDHPSGARWGPLYFCLLQKVQQSTKSVEEAM